MSLGIFLSDEPNNAFFILPGLSCCSYFFKEIAACFLSGLQSSGLKSGTDDKDTKITEERKLQ